MKTTEMAHRYWKEIVQKGDIVIDATLGNGHDTIFLAKLLEGTGQIFSYDVQEEAFEKSHLHFKEYLTRKEESTITLIHASHESFLQQSAKLIVYNLGYLPGGNKQLTTTRQTTLKSLEHALKIAHGMISIMCYPGHPEGQQEESAIFSWCEKLSSKEWTVSHHRWINRKIAPSLFLIVKNSP